MRGAKGISRALLKQAVGRTLARALPLSTYRRSLFLFGHMRCGSTALSNVLCSRPDISGHGEAHVRYTDLTSPGQLALNHMRHRAFRPGALYLFDKVLHSHYDRDCPEALFSAQGIFLVREPGPAIRSIRTLFTAIGSHEYPDDRAAADYYEQRMEQLARLWEHFPAQRRIGTSHARLTRAPDRLLAELSVQLALTPPLENRYQRTHQTRRHGTGDPLASHRFEAIMPSTRSTSLTTPGQRPDLAPSHLERLDALYQAMCALFAADRPQGPQLPPKRSEQAVEA